MHFILWVIAVILFFVGVHRLFHAQWVEGLLFFIAAALVGPGGVSVFT